MIAGWNSCPRLEEGEAESTTVRFDHLGVAPANERFDITMREKPVAGDPQAPWRSAHTAWNAVPSNVMEGCVVVRKLDEVLFCVNAQMFDTRIGLLNVFPSSLETADTIASVCFPPAKRRQTTTTRCVVRA